MSPSWFERLDRAATGAGFIFKGAMWDQNAIMHVMFKCGVINYTLILFDPDADNAAKKLEDEIKLIGSVRK